MRIIPSGKLAHMLRGRPDLLEGFDVDPDELAHYRRDVDNHHPAADDDTREALAVYTALTHPNAAHNAPAVPAEAHEESTRIHHARIVNAQLREAETTRQITAKLIAGALEALEKNLDGLQAVTHEAALQQAEDARVGRDLSSASTVSIAGEIRGAAAILKASAELAAAEAAASSQALFTAFQQAAAASAERAGERAARSAKTEKRADIARWIIVAILLLILGALFAPRAHAQGRDNLIVQLQSNGSTLGTAGGILKLNCSAATYSANTWTCSSGAPSGFSITGSYSPNTATLLTQPTTANALFQGNYLPNGTGTSSMLQVFNSSDQLNAGFVRMRANGATATIGTVLNGTGTPITKLRLGEFSSATAALTAIEFAFGNGVTKGSISSAGVFNGTGLNISTIASALAKIDSLGNLAAAVAGTDYDAAGAAAAAQAASEPAIAAGTVTQFWRGDKTWQTVPAFPNAALKGCVIVSSFQNGTSANIGWIGGKLVGEACGSKITYWPVAGYIRNLTISTSTTNTGASMRGGITVDCATTTLGPGGAMVPLKAAAGAFTDTVNAWHLGLGGMTQFGFTLQNASSVPSAVVAIAGEFIGDGADYPTILASEPNASLTASTTGYTGPYGANFQKASDVLAAVAIPYAGTVSGFELCQNFGVPTNAETWTLRVNGASPTSGPAFTIAAGDAQTQCYSDLVNTATVNQGDTIDFQSVTSSGTVSNVGSISAVVKPASGTSTMIGGGIGNTVSTSLTYYYLNGATSSTTLANAETGLPAAYTLDRFYVVQGTANGAGVTTTCTIYKNGSATAVTGTITSASGTGAQLLDGTHSVAFAQKDLITMGCSTASGTSGTITSWSARLT